MDSAGFNWTLLTIVGPLLLLIVIAWALLRNRRSGRSDVDSEAATRQVYEDEDREHRHESDHVP
ncbi:MAG TPA: hypothetical protein VFO69_05885 [Allosphingosinicella sp.]|nr:hypothetical protein [Allosphingosinicella sp.]